MSTLITIFSRHGCHLCEVAEATLTELKEVLDFEIEVNFIDGQALQPLSFGKTDAATNQWIPKKFAGTYGTNGYYLKFSDASAATAAAIGKDSSPNGNNYTPNGISARRAHGTLSDDG
mgnify:CR=1 FL=1